ncbi:DUF402 domain-containing protein [Streptacidiphilus sp. ASG 303]|uniref:DUF402 domain-containing protein n=1 Tax=Streptacidiphilus sp. ASG 303 TaxID=2896847 RepID=UPI001E28A8F2|nr:DUF402 domain-containing protein [Streptacidiphilus sp. ASG 303]MCD0481744.1 DUF402 domain-containing protein [Streptacidiphilus sp. ASG 303]
MERFGSGETVVRRDVFRGRVWSAHALRVVRDTGEAVVATCGPGAEAMVATSYVESRTTGDDAVRRQALPGLAAGRWRLDRWAWQDTVSVLWNPADTYFSVNAFYEPSGDRRMRSWYVDFQRPIRRTGIGFDTFDLLVDLVVDPDLSSWRWKDEDEYAQGRRLGIVDDADHWAVEAAHDRALAVVEGREGPFAPDAEWMRCPSGPLGPPPLLPAGTLATDSAAADARDGAGTARAAHGPRAARSGPRAE